MKRFDEHLLEQEVTDLADIPTRKDLREALAQRGFGPDEILMAGYMEGENGTEWGAFVTKDGEAYHFERDAEAREASSDFTKLERITNVPEMTEKAFPALQTAIRMMAEKHS